MTFFNKKEEVMDIEITSYGRYLLSKGKFKPAFYAFSDDEILYDVNYGDNITETQKMPLERIQQDTIRVKTLYDHRGAETRVKERNKQNTSEENSSHPEDCNDVHSRLPLDDIYGSDGIEESQMNSDNRRLMRNLLGTAATGEKFAPAWLVESLNDTPFNLPIEVSSSEANVGIPRPQINIIPNYNLIAEELTDPESNITIDEYFGQDNWANSFQFIDGVVLGLEEETIALSFAEQNSRPDAYDGSDFEIEFFLVEEKEVTDASGVVKKEEQLLLLHHDGPVDKNNLEAYLEVLTDDEAYLIGEEFVAEDGDEFEYGQDFEEGLCDD